MISGEERPLCPSPEEVEAGSYSQNWWLGPGVTMATKRERGGGGEETLAYTLCTLETAIGSPLCRRVCVACEWCI